MNEVIKTIMDRKSVREYEDRPISNEDRLTILNASCAAPTAGNQQMYTIIDVADQKIRDELVKTCDNQDFIGRAQMVLVYCADVLKWYRGFANAGASPRRQDVGDLFLAVSDACIAAQNGVIAAQSLGIGSCYIGDILENCERQRELLKIPEYVLPCAMVVFGYPAKSQLEKTKTKRAPLECIVSENRYPEMDEDYLYRLFGKDMEKDKYIEWMNRFCERKYNSAFAEEMQRSVREYLKQYE